MMGITGLRMIHRDSKETVAAPMNFIDVSFPKKMNVMSMALHDTFGRPVYRKDTKV
jgi:hypothetical protein